MAGYTFAEVANTPEFRVTFSDATPDAEVTGPTEYADLPTWEDRDAEADALAELWAEIFGM